MYYRHFRLTGPPFEVSPGPDAIYLSRAHRESLAALEWGLLHEPSGFTTLTGEIGTGKTTLVCSILARNFAHLSAAYVINPKLSFEDILRVVLGQFGVPCAGTTKLDRIEALTGFLGRRMPHERLAIIVDEAQDLSEDVLEELRLLSNYGQRLGRYLQLVLVGTPELALRLKNPSLRQFNQRVAARSVLSRLTFAEAHEYVGYRLRARTGRSRDIFDSNALSYLLRHSGGIPRKINVLCHNAMLLTYSAEGLRVDMKAARAAVAEHGESLLGGLRLTIPPKWEQPTFLGVAALGLLLFAGYAYKGISTAVPRPASNVSVKVASKPTSKIIATKVIVDASALPAAPVVTQSRPGTQPQETAHDSTTGSGSETMQQRENVAAVVLPGLLPSDSDIHHEQNETRQHEEISGTQSVDASTISASPVADQKRSISVKYGDTLEKLALQHFGSRYALNVLIDANPQIMDINKIYPGQRIYLSVAGNSDAGKASAARLASRRSGS